MRGLSRISKLSVFEIVGYSMSDAGIDSPDVRLLRPESDVFHVRGGNSIYIQPEQ